MRLALESPTEHLGIVQPFADFDWILTHKVLEDEEYARHYEESSNLKFLDNSVNELGEPATLDQTKEAIEKLGRVDYVVASDWIGDMAKTVEAYREFKNEFGLAKVVGVLQGNTPEEALGCLRYYDCQVIAVPYDICSSREDPPYLMGLRRALIASHIPSEKFIHLLGFTSLEEFFWYKGKQNFLSVDTGIPVMLGLQEKDILDGIEDKSKDTWSKMQNLELTQTKYTAICRNIALLRKELA